MEALEAFGSARLDLRMLRALFNDDEELRALFFETFDPDGAETGKVPGRWRTNSPGWFMIDRKDEDE
jgi:hypothetical protein